MAVSLNEAEVNFVESLGHISRFRGLDSTGVTAFHRKKNKLYYHLEKSVEDPNTFLQGDQWANIKKHQPFVIAGHSRAATIGSINVENAHPFHIGDIIGMHNGTIHGLAPKDGKTTDSQEIMYLLDVAKPDEVVEVYKELEAYYNPAYALVWVDLRDSTINFLRNDKRTLYFLKGMGGCLFWASELRMLNFVRQGFNANFEDIKPLPVGMHFKYRLGYPVANSTVNDFNPPAIPKPLHIADRTPHYSELWKDDVPVMNRSALDRFPYKDQKYVRVDHSPVTVPFLKRPSVQDTPSTSTSLTPLTNIMTAIGTPIKAATVAPNFEILYEGFLKQPFKPEYIERILKNKECVGCGIHSELHERVGWIGYEQYVCDSCLIDQTVMAQLPTQVYEGRLMIPTGAKN